jgi:hypothetical protein
MKSSHEDSALDEESQSIDRSDEHDESLFDEDRKDEAVDGIEFVHDDDAVDGGGSDEESVGPLEGAAVSAQSCRE